jgi:hypothetical protein
VATFDPVNNTPQLGPQVGAGHRANVATFDPVNNTPQLGPQVGGSCTCTNNRACKMLRTMALESNCSVSNQMELRSL